MFNGKWLCFFLVSSWKAGKQAFIALKNWLRFDETFLQYSLLFGLPVAWGQCKHTLHLCEGNSKLSLALQHTSVSDLSLCQTLLAFLNRRYSVFFSAAPAQTTGFHFWVHHHPAAVQTPILETPTDNLILFCCQHMLEERPLNSLLWFPKFCSKLCIPCTPHFLQEWASSSCFNQQKQAPFSLHCSPLQGFYRDPAKGISLSIQKSVVMVASTLSSNLYASFKFSESSSCVWSFKYFVIELF